MDRIERNVIIARSGVYAYGKDELASLNLSPPTEQKDVYYVYRPAIVLTKNKDKFTKLPLTKEHPAEMVGPENFKELAIGWSSDTADICMMDNSQEIGIQSTCNLLDESALEYYDNGVRDVSPGYFATFEWAKGETVDGESYDIIMTDIEEVNHLAFTQRGRGGQGVAMDAEFKESDHPRRSDGKFGSGGGGKQPELKGNETEKESENKSGTKSPAQQYDDVVKKYKGTDKWLKAPNGKPTKLSEKQWVQTQTPSFKEWFGNSKTIDENGDPLVLFHGGTTNIDDFSKGSSRGLSGIAYFSDNKDTAETYSEGIKRKSTSGTPIITDVFIKSENIFKSDSYSAWRDIKSKLTAEEIYNGMNDGFRESIDNLAEENETSPENLIDEYWNEDLQEYLTDNVFVEHENEALSNSPALKFLNASGLLPVFLKKGGYDLIKYEDSENNGNTYIPQNPNQIKSASHNDGGFISSSSKINDSLYSITYYFNRLTTDSSLPDFRTMIMDIVEYRGEYEDDEIKIGVMELLKLCDVMPDCEEKAILQRIIKDFYNVKNAFGSDDAAKTAADLVAGRYESLDSKIMEDSMKLFGKAKDAEPIPAEKEKEAPPAAPAPAPAPEPSDTAPEEPETPPLGAAPVETVQQAAMEVSEMPDDVSSLDDPNLLRCLNGVVKALKALMPGETQEPEHQEAPAIDSEIKPEEEKEPAMDSDEEEVEDGVPAFPGKTPGVTDSIFRMSMVSDSAKSKGLAEFTAGLYKRKGAK